MARRARWAPLIGTKTRGCHAPISAHPARYLVANPGGLLKEVFDGLQAQLAASRTQFYYDLPAGQAV